MGTELDQGMDTPGAVRSRKKRQGKQFQSFEEAVKFAHALKLNGQKEWHAWCKSGKRPPNIPSAPDKTYKDDGWQGYRYWLGTGRTGHTNKQFLIFKEAHAIAHELKLPGVKEWKSWCKGGTRPINVPSNPDKTYKNDGWEGWGHWLGTGNAVGNKQQFLPFEEAVAYARGLKLGGTKEWVAWCKTGDRPNNIPSNPGQVYKNEGWQKWAHWLDTTTVGGAKLDVLPFADALKFVWKLKLTNQEKWHAWCKSPERATNIPTNPQRTYKYDGWLGWGHWLRNATPTPSAITAAAKYAGDKAAGLVPQSNKKRKSMSAPPPPVMDHPVQAHMHAAPGPPMEAPPMASEDPDAKRAKLHEHQANVVPLQAAQAVAGMTHEQQQQQQQQHLAAHQAAQHMAAQQAAQHQAHLVAQQQQQQQQQELLQQQQVLQQNEQLQAQQQHQEHQQQQQQQQQQQEQQQQQQAVPVSAPAQVVQQHQHQQMPADPGAPAHPQ